MNHTLRKWIALLLALLMLPLAVFAETVTETEPEEAATEEAPTEEAAAEETAPGDPATHTVEGHTYPYLRSFDDEEIVESEMTLYFIDGSDVPYVALSEYMVFFAGLMRDYDEWEDFTYEVQRIDEEDSDISTYWVERSDNNTTMVVLPHVSQIWFDSYNLFMAKPGVTSLVSALDLPEPDEGPDIMALIEEAETVAAEMEARGEEIPEDFFENYFAIADPGATHEFFYNAGGSYDRHGSGIYLDLQDYGIYFYSIDGECYIPFQTMNDLFMCQNYLQFIFNGQTVLGGAYGCDELFARAHEAEPEEMSIDMSLFNYNELMFLLDTFYGLKPEHGITGFADMITHNPSLSRAFMSGLSQDFDDALMMLLGFYLDDLHSGFGASSWRTNDGSEDATFEEFFKFLSAMGFSNASYMSDSFYFSAKREDVWPDGCPGYEEIGDTAFVTFDGFNCSAVEESYSEYYDLGIPATLEECGEDTIRLIQYANAQILREDSPIRNVVIDLSNNGGGSVSAAVAVMCWYLGDCSFCLRDTMTGSLSIMHYQCDLNLNGRIQSDDGDSLAGHGLNLYCIISPLSFSCGNLVPAFFRESHRVTLIGQRSGGGSCVVLPCTSASGTTFQISGPKQISLVRNGSFYNADQGVEPHIPLTHIESFYDREALVELINSTP